MKGWIKHPFRATFRLLWLAAELALAALRYFSRFDSRQPDGPSPERSAWLRQTATRLLPVLKLRPNVTGPVPPSGLLVCNHLSYTDIVALASIAPCVFVSKGEVRRWPVFGWFARKSGTIFVDRKKPTEAGHVNGQIATALQKGALVVLFPEGTSSDGRTVLPFKSSLLEPVSRQAQPIYVGWITYELDDGDVAEEVCYWKDMTLLPHMLNLLTKREVRASIHFTRVHGASADRKELARQLHLEVSLLKDTVKLHTEVIARVR